MENQLRYRSDHLIIELDDFHLGELEDTVRVICFFFSSRRRHTRFDCDWSSDVCSSDLPGIRKEDVGHETIMIHFKGGKTEPDYPGEKWLRLAQDLASKVRKGERVIPLTEQHGTNILRKYAKLAGVPNWDRLHNHRQRAYFGTYWARKTGRDYWKVQSLMGHKDLRATAVYVEELSLDEKKQLLDGSYQLAGRLPPEPLGN